MKPSKHIIELENKLRNQINEWFPETEAPNNTRNKVLVIAMMGKELGVQGHADNIKQKNDAKGGLDE